MKKTKIAIILLFSIFFFQPNFVLAGFDFYVDAGEDSGGDGSKDKPFNKIQKAIDKGGKDIYIKNGSYNEELSLSKKVTLEGESKSKVVIEGKVEMGDDSELKNLTVEKGGISVGSGKSVKIENVIVKKASTGIITSGNGTLTVSKCDIIDNGKGFYIQKDKDVSITETLVEGNAEEGIDIRSNVDGVIKNNTIKNNSEGGIEVIAGGSELTISSNTIKNNKASGIAIQYYEIADKVGGLKIYSNSISGNGNFGVVCKSPSGGEYSSDYWTKSVDMGANNIFSNKKGSFSSDCKFSANFKNVATKTAEQIEQEKKEAEELVKELEKKKLEEEEKKKLEEEKQKSLEEEQRFAELEQKRLEEKIAKNNEIKEESNNLKNDFNQVKNKADELKKDVENRSVITTFFLGSDYKKLNELTNEVNSLNEDLESLEKLEEQVTDQEIQNSIKLEIFKIEESKKSYLNFVKQESDKFGLAIWLSNFF